MSAEEMKSRLLWSEPTPTPASETFFDYFAIVGYKGSKNKRLGIVYQFPEQQGEPMRHVLAIQWNMGENLTLICFC